MKDQIGCAAMVAIILAIGGVLVAENYLGILSGCDMACKDRRTERQVEKFRRLPSDEQERILQEYRDERREDSYRGF